MLTCNTAMTQVKLTAELKKKHTLKDILPWCLVMSISWEAALAPFRAPSTTASGEPTKVYTVRLVEIPGSTSSRLQPSVEAIALAMASITWKSKMTWNNAHITSLHLIGNLHSLCSLLTDELRILWSGATEHFNQLIHTIVFRIPRVFSPTTSINKFSKELVSFVKPDLQQPVTLLRSA